MSYPATSRAAWGDQTPETRDKQNRRILEALDASGGGLTSDELEHRLDIPHQTASAYVSHLRAGWLIEDSGARRPTRHGRAAIVWRRRSEPQTIEETLADYLHRLKSTQAELGRAQRRCVKISARVAAIRGSMEDYVMNHLGALQGNDEKKEGTINGE
jgi:hypothetical protein